MTSTAPALEAGGATRERPRRWRVRFALGAIAGFALVLAAAGVALSTWDAGYLGRVLPGVRAGAVDLSGLTADAAATTLGAAYAPAQGRLVLRTSTGDIAIPYADVGRRLDVDATVATALAAGRGGDTLERVTAELRVALDGTIVEPRIVLDETALADRIAAALTPLNRPAVDPRVSIRPDGPIVTPAQAGRRFDPAPAIATALERLRRVDAPGELVIEVPMTPVTSPVTKDAVLSAVSRARWMLQDVVVSYGKSSWTIRASTVGTWISFDTTPSGWVVPYVNRDDVIASLDTISSKVLRKPQSALYLVNRAGKVVGVAAGRNGRRLDPEATAARIVTEVMTRSRGNPPRRVAAAAIAVAPELTTDEATRTAPLLTKLGSWTTWFPISERNYYGANIWRPAAYINGTVLAPGQRFEWWSAIGPVTSARGFGLGGFIAGDHTEPTGAIGGGMCSSSTTLFNAALRAGLKMGARSNHRYYIDRYPLGLDATVSGGLGRGQTVSFTNDTGNPILIRGIKIRSGGKGYVRYEIWGIPDGRTVSISRPSVANVRIATTNVVETTSLPHGVRNQVEYPANGMDVTVTRVVRNAAGRVIHSDTYRSHYTLWNGLILVGA